MWCALPRFPRLVLQRPRIHQVDADLQAEPTAACRPGRMGVQFEDPTLGDARRLLDAPTHGMAFSSGGPKSTSNHRPTRRRSQGARKVDHPWEGEVELARPDRARDILAHLDLKGNSGFRVDGAKTERFPPSMTCDYYLLKRSGTYVHQISALRFLSS
jgi:hypothetical protein